MGKFKKWLIETTDNIVNIKTTNNKLIPVIESDLSFLSWESIEFQTDEYWDLSCIKKASWELEKIFTMFDRDGKETNIKYKQVLFNAIPVTSKDWAEAIVVALKEKIPGELTTAYGLRLWWIPRDWQNALETGGITTYSYKDHTEEEMKNFAQKLADFCNKQDSVDKIRPSEIGFVWKEI